MASQTTTGDGVGKMMTLESGVKYDIGVLKAICALLYLRQMESTLMSCSLIPAALLYRVEQQKMTIVRPPADVARYTMVFHKRDTGNQINKNRSVHPYNNYYFFKYRV